MATRSATAAQDPASVSPNEVQERIVKLVTSLHLLFDDIIGTLTRGRNVRVPPQAQQHVVWEAQTKILASRLRQFNTVCDEVQSLVIREKQEIINRLRAHALLGNGSAVSKGMSLDDRLNELEVLESTLGALADGLQVSLPTS